MKTASIISYVIAGVFIIFGFLFMLSAFDPSAPDSRLFVGLAGLAIGFAFIYAGSRFAAKARQMTAQQNVTLNVDLPGNVKMDTIKCQACGAPLSADDIKIVNGAPMVTCHSCGTAYQITEEPKW